jgi:Clr5 domain
MPRLNWDDHKEAIRELFLDQDKTHKDVAALLTERYGLDIG